MSNIKQTPVEHEVQIIAIITEKNKKKKKEKEQQKDDRTEIAEGGQVYWNRLGESQI